MNKKIVFCDCGGNLLKAEFKDQILEALQQEGISFTKVSDLCGVCTNQKQDILDLVSDSEELLILACHPRAVKLLFDKTGITKESGNIHFLNFLEPEQANLLRELKKFSDSGNILAGTSEIKSDTSWPAWFPLIDYSRCTSCGQCADFCLFGVYEKTEDRVVVVNPEGCKNNCPACARICPQTAIIFPKYEHGGAIAGDVSINEMEEQERQRKDIDAILGSEIYQALERRKLKRQSIIKNSALQEAEKEREKALNESRKN